MPPDNGPGERLRSARRELGLSQRSVAAELGVTIRTVQNYEAGRPVPERNLLRLALVLGRSVGWLLTGSDADGARNLESLAELRSQRRTLSDNLQRLKVLRREMEAHLAHQKRLSTERPLQSRVSE